MKLCRLKKLVLIAMPLIWNSVLFAQVADTSISNEKGSPSAFAAHENMPLNTGQVDRNHILKINVPALFLANFALQYEWKLGKKNSLAIAARFRPNSSLPFQKNVEDFIDAPSIRVDLFKVGQIGITPEYRFYLSKKGALRGFYIGPFINYTHYSGNVPVNYYDYVNNVSIDKTADFKGSANTYTAGFQLGAQWKLSNRVYLDWWILGPNYGFCNGNFIFTGSLNDIEQISLRYELEKIQYTIPLVKIGFPKGHPTATGATFGVTGPWAGIRAFGVNLGYRF